MSTYPVVRSVEIARRSAPRRGRPPAHEPPKFHVPYCSNPNCLYFFHPPEAGTLWCVHHGFYPTRAHGTVPRARCLRCGSTFSRQTFSIGYYTKVHLDPVRLLLELAGGAALRAISRAHGCSLGSVSNRLQRLCRQAIAMHQSLLGSLTLGEPLVADGFVDFTVSQYFPDALTMISGKDTQMIYAIAHCILRRRGRMSEAQKRQRSRLEQYYRAPVRGEEHALTDALFDTLSAVTTGDERPIRLYTDEHTAYPPAVEQARAGLEFIGRRCTIEHRRVNSRIAHAGVSELFSANYLDRQLRLSLAAHRRETICYGRNEVANLERAVLYLVWHNYNKPYRIVDRAEQPPPHAVVAGVIERKVYWWWKLFFTSRVRLMKVQPEGYMRRIWLKTVETPLKQRGEYLPRYACV